MLSISIGPLAFPVAPLITLAAIWTGAIVAGRVAGKTKVAEGESNIWWAAVFGLLGARLGYVATYYDAYWEHPWSILDIRDGGWLAWAGFVVAAIWISRKAWQQASMRRSIASGAVVACCIWFGANAAVWLSQSDGAKTIPDITVNQLNNGQARQLPAVIAGQPSVVNIWATWCGPCRIEMPVLANAQQAHRDIRFVFVNQGERASRIHAYLKQEQLELEQVWIDPTSALLSQVGSSGLPTTLFFDKDGRQVDAHFGVLSAAALAAKVSALSR